MFWKSWDLVGWHWSLTHRQQNIVLLGLSKVESLSAIAPFYGVKSLAWKSNGVKPLTNIMSSQMHSHDLVWQGRHFADFMNVNRQWIGSIPEYRPFAADSEGNWWNFLPAIRLSTSRITLYITDYHYHHWGPLYANPLIPSEQENRLKTSCHSRVPANKLTGKRRQKLFSCHLVGSRQ